MLQIYYTTTQDKTKADREPEKGNHYYRQRVCAVCGSTYWPTQSAYWRYGMLKQKRCSWKFTIQKDGIEFFGLENALKKAIFKRLGCI